MKALPFSNTLNLATKTVPVLSQVIPQFKRTVSYFNTSGRIVTVSDRLGMKVEVHSDNSNASSSFVIKIEYVLLPAQREYFEREVLQHKDEDCYLLIKLKEAYKRDVKLKRIHRFTTMNLSIELGIDLDGIDKLGGSVYLEDLDIVLSTMTCDKAPNHPLSLNGSLKSVAARSNQTTGYQYLYVCNDDFDNADPLYCVLNDAVFPINPSVEPTMRNGLYVTLPEDKHGNRETYFYSTVEEVKNDIDVIRVFTDEYSAKEYIGNNVSMSLKIAEIKKQTEEVSAKVSLDKADLDITKVQADREKLLADKEKLIADRELATVKNNYEHQSHVRKDTTEVFKHIPAVILGIAAVVGALFKVFG